MSTTFVPTNNMENGFIIVTHVVPAQPARAGTGQNESAGRFFNRLLSRTTGHDQDQSTPDPARVFLKREPKVLGTVQIMIALMSFLFSIVLIQDITTLLFVHTLHGFWGSSIHIITGALSVAAENKFSLRLVKVLMVLNAVSAVTAGIAVILHSLDIASGPYNITYMHSNCSLFMIIGISGVLLVFSLLQFIISICMMLFGFDATCCAEPMVCIGSEFPNNNSLNNPFHVHSNEENVFVINNPNMDNSLLANLPPYNETEPPI